MRLSLFCYLGFLARSFAAPPPSPAATTSTVSAPHPQPTICGDIVNSCNYTFTAKQAYDCLTSVPFNAAVASNLISYYNDTIQFQSTLAYLRNPPPSYQQPAVDLVHGLNHIQHQIDNGVFQNEYAFEATLQNLLYSTHDAHIELVAGILQAFNFYSPYSIVSLSTDGRQLPKVYITSDIWSVEVDGEQWAYSAIATINGQNATAYLAEFAAINSVGTLEPNADWNQLMSSSALNIQDYYSVFEGAITFYPGEDITFVFENGTNTGALSWMSTYNSPGPTGPLATGGDFYNFFVLGQYPASYDPSAIDPCAVEADSGVAASTTSSADTAATTTIATTTSTSPSPITPAAAPTPTSWADFAYPNASLSQPTMYPLGGGFVTGYFLKNISTAVLSIPTFQMSNADITTFSETVGYFIKASQNAGMQKVIVDVQQNLGGDTLLAVDTFRQFFPNIDPFNGNRLRAHSMANIIGSTFTTYYETEPLDYDLYEYLSGSNWVATPRIDADTGANFTSWEQLYGPHFYNGDAFTTTERENLSSTIFDSANLGITVYGYADRPATSKQPPYPAENIVILSDAICSSACAVFMEMMTHDAGVRVVVAGGLPQHGSMQAPSGTRGYQYYSNINLDADFEIAELMSPGITNFLPNRTNEDIWISYAGINLRDQIRKNETVPLQFAYEAADCRIFFTPSTIFNYANLWTYAANAIWSNPSLCVQGSTGHASNSTNTQGSPVSRAYPAVPVNMTNIMQLSGMTSTDIAEFGTGEHDSVGAFSRSNIGQACSIAKGAPSSQLCRGLTCQSICGGHRCFADCNNYGNPCTNGYCSIIPGLARGAFVDQTTGIQTPRRAGFCVPSWFSCGTSTGHFAATVSTPPEVDDVERKGSGSAGGLLASLVGLSDLITKGLSRWR